MLKENTWDLLKEYYSKTFGVNPAIVDYIAVHDILELCARGYCVSRIARHIEDDEQYVTDVLKEFFNFDGFEEDIDFDVKPLYDRYKYNKYLFCSRAHELDRIATPLTINELYRINRKLQIIESEIENYYAKA